MINIQAFVCAFIQRNIKKVDFHPHLTPVQVGDSLFGIVSEEIQFTYETVRGNLKSNTKVVIDFKGNDLSETFLAWVRDFNYSYSYRSLLNVQILGKDTVISA